MNSLVSFITIIAMALASSGAMASDTRGTKEEAEAMVKKAVQYYQKNGREKAIAEFQRKPGPFVDRDLYVTVYDLQANCLSHINPKMVGKNMMDLRDGEGKYHIRERMEAAKTHNSGWHDFTFFNPVSKKIEPKTMYWEKYDNRVFAAGAYKAQEPARRSRARF